MPCSIRQSVPSDLQDLLQVHRLAFGGSVEAELVAALLDDPTAQPLLSLVAVADSLIQGHVLFTAVRLTEPASDAGAAILAPLAVAPAAQGKGLGSQLVEAGLGELRQAGVALVFVLGDPAYYGRFGFAPAALWALLAPYDLPPAYAEAWQVFCLTDNGASPRGHRLRCAAALDRPELWLP